MEYYSVNSDEIIGDHDIHFDDERPPVYNAEDYAAHLKKFSSLSELQEYKRSNNSLGSRSARILKSSNRNIGSSYDDLDGFTYEMGLRQFSSVSQLLNKLKVDLHLSYNSFVREFISAPNDGVTLLLDLLKLIQLSQTTPDDSKEQKMNPSGSKKLFSDEYDALLCLKLCTELEDGAAKIIEHSSGVFTVSVCVMSNFSKSRVLALQILTRCIDIILYLK